MINLKIKLRTGFRKDQEYTVDIEEAHKAYYLFMNPEVRAIFGDGLALKGSAIEAIEPDYHATMGWHKSHTLDNSDWEELRRHGIPDAIRIKLQKAKKLAPGMDQKFLSKTLSEIEILEESSSPVLLG